MAKKTGESNVLRLALRRALRPLVRLAIQRSVLLMDLFETLKVVYVEVAEAELKKNMANPSVSQISVMTGVHRKDVSRIKETGRPVRESDSIIEKVIGQWMNNPNYQNENGKPRALGAEGLDSEFLSLVRSVSVDVAPYTVLNEMKRLGIVEQTIKGFRLRAAQYLLPKGQVKEALNMLGEDLEDLAGAVTENINHGPAAEETNLHLKTEYTKIPLSSLTSIKQWLRKEGTAFHQKVSCYLAGYDADFNKDTCVRGPYVRVSYGSYSYAGEKE